MSYAHPAILYIRPAQKPKHFRVEYESMLKATASCVERYIEQMRLSGIEPRVYPFLLKGGWPDEELRLYTENGVWRNASRMGSLSSAWSIGLGEEGSHLLG
ncbi:hypothetical protein QQ045_033006 [Rhodiola kirilowii]